jgi:hypothetical protein
MPIPLEELRAAGNRAYTIKSAGSLVEARASRQRTAFLCHSHHDNILAKGLQVKLQESGLTLYIDWQDVAMPEAPDRVTAQRIKDKIRALDWFLFLATPQSTKSVWCPWEIGFADSVKSHEKMFVIVTEDSSGRWFGNEYLQLYQQISSTQAAGLCAFQAGNVEGGIRVSGL